MIPYTQVPVRIKMVLNEHQFFGADKWKYTFDGEERIAPYKVIEFMAFTIEDAIHRIKYSELESIVITANFNHPELLKSENH